MIATRAQSAAAQPVRIPRLDRAYPSARRWSDEDRFEVGEIAGWVFNNEERGRRGKR